MASPTPAQVRKTQDTKITKLLEDLSCAQITATTKTAKRKKIRLISVSTKEKFAAFTSSEVMTQLEGFVQAIDEVLARDGAHELIVDVMQDCVETEWKKVRDGSLEKTEEVIKKWTVEFEKLRRKYEEEVEKMYRNAGVSGDGKL